MRACWSNRRSTASNRSSSENVREKPEPPPLTQDGKFSFSQRSSEVDNHLPVCFQRSYLQTLDTLWSQMHGGHSVQEGRAAVEHGACPYGPDENLQASDDGEDYPGLKGLSN